MAFPMGLAGVWEERLKPWWKERRQALRDAAVKSPEELRAAAAPVASVATLPEGASAQSV